MLDEAHITVAGKTLVFRFSLLTWLLLALWPGEAGADDRRVALVVGVSNYKHAPRLANTHNDARGTADALRRLGFEVEQLLDPDRGALEAGVRKLRQRAQGAETSLFYYAGHAIELGGRNWLLPVAADVQTDRDVRFEGLDLDFILEQMEGASRISLVFMDACRENPFRAKLAAVPANADAWARPDRAELWHVRRVRDCARNRRTGRHGYEQPLHVRVAQVHRNARARTAAVAVADPW